MPLFNRPALLSNLTVNVEGGTGNFCPGSIVQGTMTFQTSMPQTVMKSLRIELIGVLEIQKHKNEILRRERLVHYVTHYTKPVLAEVDTSCMQAGAENACCATDECAPNCECGTSSSDEEQPAPVTAVPAGTPNAATCVLPAGNHSFPFSFLIPQDALATFNVTLPFRGPSFLAYTLVAVVHPRRNLLPIFHKVPLQVLSVAPEYQLAAESLPGTASVTAPLSGFFTNNGAAEVVATVSTTMLCLSAPPPIIVSLQVDNFGGKKPITRVEAALTMVMAYSTRHGLNLEAVVDVGKVLLNGNVIPTGGKGSFGGHLSFDESKRALAIPTFQTSYTSVNWFVSIEIKEAKKTIRVPLTVVGVSDPSNSVAWNHHEKPRASLSEGQYYEVAPPFPVLGEPVMGSVVA
jgi:hypothetical protein